MSNPLSSGALVRALREEGVRVVERPGWRDNNRNHAGPWGPVHGVMIHHTVTSGTESSVSLCYNGRSDLPGPLCHGVIDKDGTVYLVGNGRANHAGRGDGNVLDAVRGEHPLPPDNETDTDGNTHFYGFECINLGDGRDPWPPAQVDAIIRVSAAICRAHGWTHRSVIGHLEWQPGKIDPRGPGITMEGVRKGVAERLTPAPGEGDDMPIHSIFERSTGLSITAGEWFTVTWDRVYRTGEGWSGRELAQTILSGPASYSLSFAARITGMARGEEVQMRVARNARESNGDWALAYSRPISTSVHDSGFMHAAHSWTGFVPGSDDNRLVCKLMVPEGENLFVDQLTCELLSWKV